MFHVSFKPHNGNQLRSNFKGSKSYKVCFLTHVKLKIIPLKIKRYEKTLNIRETNKYDLKITQWVKEKIRIKCILNWFKMKQQSRFRCVLMINSNVNISERHSTNATIQTPLENQKGGILLKQYIRPQITLLLKPEGRHKKKKIND